MRIVNQSPSNLEHGVDFVRTRVSAVPRVGVVLGSGLGGFVDGLSLPTSIAYSEVPGFPQSSVPGHAGRFVFGALDGVPLAVMQGRVHMYEGYSAQDVVMPSRLLCLLGVDLLVVTNAAGGISPSLQAGDLMLIEDHINLTGTNPLIGESALAYGPRFVGMVDAYDVNLIRSAERTARTLGISLKRGVYAGMLGPTYETPAEVRMLRTLGADAVGMSTVLEVIAARQLQKRVLGISCITNTAAGLDISLTSHEEVQTVAQGATKNLSELLQHTLKDSKV